MCLKLPPRDLTLTSLPHLTSIYTCKMIIAQKVCGDILYNLSFLINILELPLSNCLTKTKIISILKSKSLIQLQRSLKNAKKKMTMNSQFLSLKIYYLLAKAKIKN